MRVERGESQLCSPVTQTLVLPGQFHAFPAGAPRILEGGSAAAIGCGYDLVPRSRLEDSGRQKALCNTSLRTYLRAVVHRRPKPKVESTKTAGTIRQFIECRC